MQIFSLDGRPHITLDNLLKFEGWCESGGMAKQLIAEGNVLVDGKVETRKRCKIISGQTVAFNGEEILITND
ncbi:MAG: ribosome-associated protein YbcJ [Kangiellaceae bacterium]|nr:ribosome-associated protein YbcJ [Kangiellaceae bacterium]